MLVTDQLAGDRGNIRVVSAEEEATFWSAMLFQWMNPLMRLGYAQPLQSEHLQQLPVQEDTRTVARIFRAFLNKNLFEHKRERRKRAGTVSGLPGSPSPRETTSPAKPAHKSTGATSLTTSSSGTPLEPLLPSSNRSSQESPPAASVKSPVPPLSLRTEASTKAASSSPSSAASSRSFSSMHKVVLVRALYSTVGRDFVLLGIPKLLSSMLVFAGPILLHELVDFVSDDSQPMWHGYAYATTMLVAALLATFLSVYYGYLLGKIGIRARTCLVTSIYQKALRINAESRLRFTTGEIVNYMSTDTDRIVNFFNFHEFWSLPLQFSICLYLLYTQVGLAFLAGLGFAILLIPLNKYIANKIAVASEAMMKSKDERVKLTSEVLYGIRLIKFLAWEGSFMRKIMAVRKEEPTLLLLDEPTNHLDLFAVIWLETYLHTWKNTLLVVSHDQDFVNSVCNDTIHIYQQRLDYYKGNYDHFKHAFNEKVGLARKMYDKQVKILKQEKLQKAKKDEKEKAQKKSRDMTKVLRNKQMKAGKKGKDEEDEATLNANRPAILEAVPRDYSVQFDFPEPSPLSIPVIQVKDASFWYKEDKVIFRDLDFGVDLESRIALVGPNGAGKSTLLKLLAGELEPTGGQIERNRKLIIGKFTQHFVDKLNMNQTPIGYIISNFPDMKEGEVRQMLGRFGLTGVTQVQQIATLSGGQKSRVVFAEICMREPHILFLDEPTNHLDVESIDALAEALNEFKGGLVLVSHDSRLITEVCSEVWVVGDNTVTIEDGDFDDYRSRLVQEFEEQQEREEQERKEKEEERRKKREEEWKVKEAQRLERVKAKKAQK